MEKKIKIYYDDTPDNIVSEISGKLQEFGFQIVEGEFGDGWGEYIIKPLPQEQKINITDQTMDKCVMCNNETKYPRHMHIAFREHYVDGVGQLCDKCAENLYNEA